MAIFKGLIKALWHIIKELIKGLIKATKYTGGDTLPWFGTARTNMDGPDYANFNPLIHSSTAQKVTLSQ